MNENTYNENTYVNARYYIIDIVDGVSIKGIQTQCNGRHISFPCQENNRHYAEIMRQVEAGDLTIQDAD